jgi:chitodextrinase
VPVNLAATATSATSVSLSWAAASDDVGVAGYEVVRGGVVVGSPAGTSFVDSGVAASTTYSYVVRARDAAGNVSGDSAAVSVTTPAAGGGGGATVTVVADADAKVQEASPTTNYAAANLVVDGSPDPQKQVYLRFPVSGVSGSVVKATLRVHVNNGTNNGPTVSATGAAWTETGLTWSNRPPAAGAVLDNKAALATGAFVDYDVTAAVTGNGTVAFVLLPESSDDFIIDSRENATAANRPQLLITTG